MHGQLDLGHVYGYQLEPIDEGTLVTSYYDWSAAEQSWKDAAIFPVIPQSALRATLGILARTVAPGRPRPWPGPISDRCNSPRAAEAIALVLSCLSEA